MSQLSGRSDADVRSLLGIHTPAAWVIAACFYFSVVTLAVTSWTAGTHWAVVVALVLTALPIYGLLAIRPDPLPLGATFAIALSGPVTCALVLAVIPAPPTSGWQTWPYSSTTVIATFMCVRGRTGAAWISMLITFVIAIVWSVSTGQGMGPGLTLSVHNLGPVAMATVFAYTIRPAAKAIFELRDEATNRVAAQAAAEASLVERSAQSQQLNDLVRPMLNTVATSDSLDASTRLECALLEAELRDSLRAPALVDVDVSAAARRARARGVEAVLVDDGGADDADPAVRRSLLQHVAAELDSTESGSLTVRVLPPDRPVLATILARSAHGSRRIELDHGGHPISVGNDDISSWVKKL